MNRNDLVVVKIFVYPADLYLAKSYLESEGIVCFVRDELVNQVIPYTSSALNGIKLEVPLEQAEEAVKLLVQGGYAKEEDYNVPKGMQRTVKIVDWIKNLFKK